MKLSKVEVPQMTGYETIPFPLVKFGDYMVLVSGERIKITDWAVWTEYRDETDHYERKTQNDDTQVPVEHYPESDNKLETEPQFTDGASAPAEDGIYEDCEHDLWIQLNGASTIVADPDSGWSSPMGVAAELSECKGLPEYYAPYHRVRLMLCDM